MFKFMISDNLMLKIRILFKKDKKKAEIINKKIKEIIKSDNKTIDHYKNLRYDLSIYKRVRIDKHFILLFEVHKDKQFIIFTNFEHHDTIYKKKKKIK